MLRFSFSIVLLAATVNARAGTRRMARSCSSKYSCYALPWLLGAERTGRAAGADEDCAGRVYRLCAESAAPESDAVVFGQSVPDGDLADIYAYIKSLPDSAPSAKSVPLLNQILTAP